MSKTKYYAYLVPKSGESGVVSSWADCEKKVNGVAGARYRSFDSASEAAAWLKGGANYEIKPAKKIPKLLEGIYFDAGTGRGEGVEISVTDQNGKNLLHTLMRKKEINKHGKHLLGPDYTNNYGELLACYQALRLALRNKEKLIFGDSKLVVEYWSKGFVKKDLPKETQDLVKKTSVMRRKFEETGGSVKLISGDFNPADLGFHKG